MTTESERIGLGDVSVRLIAGRRGWKSVTDLIGKRAELSVAIAYVSSRGTELLPVRRGSSVVTDASLRSIRAGSTDPNVLLAWTRSGVSVYSLPHLHAKMIVAEGDPAFAVVGSANASGASADRLEEAVVVSDLPRFVEDARDQIISWKSQAELLTGNWLESVLDQFNADRTPTGDPEPEPVDPDPEPEGDEIDWPRPTSIYLVKTVADDSASAKAKAKLAALSSEFADADLEDVLPGQRAVWMFWTEQPGADDDGEQWVYAEGTHVVTIALTSDRLSKKAPVVEPGRVLHSFVDSAHRPARRYYFVLGLASQREDITYQDLVDALARINVKPEWDLRYMVPRKVDAILGLWPDIKYTG